MKIVKTEGPMWCGTEETPQPYPLYRHVVSLVPRTFGRDRRREHCEDLLRPQPPQGHIQGKTARKGGLSASKTVFLHQHAFKGTVEYAAKGREQKQPLNALTTRAVLSGKVR